MRNVIGRIARAKGLDGIAGPIRDAVLKPGVIKDAMNGVWLGHSLHPVLAQMPIACFTGAALLDVTGTSERAARRLVGMGLLSSAPAAMSGLADFADSHEEQRRIGIVHAAANSFALGCYVGSLLLRLSGRTRAGVAVGLVGYASVKPARRWAGIWRSGMPSGRTTLPKCPIPGLRSGLFSARPATSRTANPRGAKLVKSR
jgi:uncharacterized membrane protein